MPVPLTPVGPVVPEAGTPEVESGAAPPWMRLGEVEFLDWLIESLDAIDDRFWRVDTVRNTAPDGSVTNCVMGHVFDLGGGDELVRLDGYRVVTGGSLLWSAFEENVATTFRIYPVNDGEDPDYRQSTPRERCVAFLRAIRDNRELATCDSMEVYSRSDLGETFTEAKTAVLAEVAVRRARNRGHGPAPTS